MKKNKKKLIFSVISIFLLIVIFIIICFVINSRNDNSITLEENKWIEANKKDVIDIGVINDMPILGYDGKGIIYDYLEFVTNKHSLKFNIIPYKIDTNVEYNYKIDIVSSLGENDIVLLEDNFVVVMGDNRSFYSLDDITNLRLGILSTEKEILTNYLKDNIIEYVDFSNYTELKNALIQSQTTESTDVIKVDGIIIPKTIFSKEIIENNYKISFHLNNVKKYYVLKATGSPEFNSILKKDYNVWKKENYENSYNKNLLSNYYKFKNITDTDQKKLQSKNYVYGFIDYGIYNYLDNGKISGLNGLILKEFNKFSDLSLTYTKYNSLSTLLENFNSNKIDFIMNISSLDNYKSTIYNTNGIFNKDLVIISGVLNTTIVDSINSLKGKEVLTIKDSYLEKYLIDNNIKVKSYNNIKDLATDFSLQDIAIVDLENYNYYKSSSFKDCKINFLINLDEKYNYVINDSLDNSLFKELFDFYLNYNSIESLSIINYDDISYKNSNITYILIIIIIALSIYIVADFSIHVRYMLKSIKKNKQIHLTKEEKMKYIDQLTSLKNRAYLNSRIESWDESEIYPQSIIIIDLNNVAYINDNYGREEGDKVITEAANILIQHQLQNSEIIRTDGNEFLIYLVGYSEKQIISYLRKLNKELKGLSHGFGAASGYSIINDAIKTVDDAVNEATLDMKNNKEDIDY